jgi:hypothetical protein
VAEAGGWVDLQVDEFSDSFQAVAEHEASAVDGAEEVRDHGEAAALHAREEQRRAAAGVDTALDLGDFEMGVDFSVDANELLAALEIVDTFA